MDSRTKVLNICNPSEEPSFITFINFFSLIRTCCTTIHPGPTLLSAPRKQFSLPQSRLGSTSDLDCSSPKN